MLSFQWIFGRDRTKVDLSLRSQLGGHSVQRTLRPGAQLRHSFFPFLRPSNAFVGAELTFAAGQAPRPTGRPCLAGLDEDERRLSPAAEEQVDGPLEAPLGSSMSSGQVR